LAAVLATRLAPVALNGAMQSDDAAAAADSRDAAFQSFLNSLRPRAIRAGVRTATLDNVLPTLSFNPRVISFDRTQPGGNPNAPAAAIPAFAPYKATHVDQSRIDRGRARYGQLSSRLQRVQAETGVPGPIMMAIYGHETNYGSVVGDFDLLRSLASLAFEGRRRELFTAEFIATLKLLDSGIPRQTLKGSWAGATGYPQFLPSMYLRMARDGDGDGRKDIWNSEPDALASIGNYSPMPAGNRACPGAWRCACRRASTGRPCAHVSPRRAARASMIATAPGAPSANGGNWACSRSAIRCPPTASRRRCSSPTAPARPRIF
jgi:membrane-bound lytic murein transglycosylase B